MPTQPNRNPHNRRGLGMQRHYTPTHAGGSIDAMRSAQPDTLPSAASEQAVDATGKTQQAANATSTRAQPVVAPQAVAHNQSSVPMTARSMPIQQGSLPTGGRGSDRQEQR